ncbi:MAG: c-type cytochrome [Pseudomonadota bacterium]
MLTALFLSGAFAQVEERVKACAVCHGADGISTLAGIPSLAAQPRIFLENYLVMTREGIRGAEVMQGLLKGVPDKEIVALALHFSKLPEKFPQGKTDPALFKRGKQLAANNRCGSCHLPDFRGREQMPRLAGQREEFLAEVMLAYRQNRRPGGDTIMAASLYGIPEADFKALAHYFSRLK